MEDRIAHLMLKMSKFEFYLVNRDVAFATTKAVGKLNVVTGINWSTLAKQLEIKHSFADFDFAQCKFGLFKDTSPQYLAKTESGRLKWDSDDLPINSWERLLVRSYAQLRNNIAYGNKAQLPAPFTHSRTTEFLDAGDALIDFIAQTLFGGVDWETPITFR